MAKEAKAVASMVRTDEAAAPLATSEATASTSTSTALAPAAVGGNAELAAALDGIDVGHGGLDEVGNEDIKVAAKVWNFKGTDAAGDPIPANVFYDTVQETTAKTLDVVFLDLHKTKEWREYDEGEGKSKVRCRSNSASEDATGTMEDGSERSCRGCPDAKWTTNEKGKRTRRCGPVYNVIASELPSGEPCVLRFKRTSLPVIQQHLNRHHIGKLALGGGRRGHVPLFAMSARVSLKMSDDKKYSFPVIERGRVLANAEVRAKAEDARFYREVVLPMLEKLADKDQDGAAGGESAPDTSFNPAEFGGDDMRPGAKNGDRFADDRLR